MPKNKRVINTTVPPSSSNKGWWLLGVALIAICINGALARPAIRAFAPTYDEPVHLAAGYVYLVTGDYRLNGLHHPPFSEMWCALPLLFLKTPPLLPMTHSAWISQTWTASDQYGFADAFLYHNRVSADDMIAAGRTMQWILECALGLMILFTAWRLTGFNGALLSGAAWAFSPVFIAHGTQITTDLAFATFYFAFFAALAVLPRGWKTIVAGIAMGLCFASKYFALALVPSLLVCVAWDLWRQKKTADWVALVWIFPLALLVVAAIYRFQGLTLFWDGLANMIHRAEAGRSSFFMGQHSTSGWLMYFPVLLLLKTPLGQLLASVSGGILFARSKTLPSVLWIPPLLFFGVSCLANVQIGHRYILACYPFLMVLVSGMALGSTVWLSVGGALLLWQSVVTVRVRPHYLAYFNEIIGGPSNAYRYFTDSNVDWGQSLSQLPSVLTPEEKAHGIYLSYFGVADPHAYGLRYIDIGSTGVAGHPDDAALGLSPTTFVISATNLQSTYYADKKAFAWLHTLKPRAVVGYSLFVYDLSAYPEHLAKLRGDPL